MILSAQSIRVRGIFSPFNDRTVAYGMTFGLGPAGYDVRIAETLTLASGQAALASTIEHFDMPDDLLGHVADKSTWARRFLAVQNTIIEPGWKGFLTLELSNHGGEAIEIIAGMPIAQIILHQLDQPTERPYAGKYQDQRRGAVPAILENAQVDLEDLLAAGGVR
ncbi:Deoxycytidine triphosphate deaminase (dUMP-forming) [Hyphomicrobium sulfonivorans]|uniref:Deoxycytidine triphosphate deaminase (DUMP-forming) n=1 Tax=Hyphomicrobium sulfonivorans TaxID=121290 RepID=A0A109BL99_HYPSL|nr:dCTP deaminase [Hyphomicrobium sulfonivorans]KWT70741.1 Deoxycytidine triphosphate deaminase (dUMP-forming) [Hyphomicrobium sulfonivorans]